MKKKLIILLSIIASCCSDDHKTACADLNIQSQEDLSCEQVAKQYNCSCD